MWRVMGIFVALLAFSSSVFAAERHYMIVFGVHDHLNRFVTAHVFAAFVKVDEQGDDPAQFPIDLKVISWLPASGKVVLFKEPELGRNLPLEESVAVPALDGRIVTKWGAVEIEKELFERASRQVARLDANEILYQAYDEGSRQNDIATNCEHAVSDIDTDRGFLHTGIRHGYFGSRMVARHFLPWIIGSLDRPDLGWLHQRLGLTQYPIDQGRW